MLNQTEDVIISTEQGSVSSIGLIILNRPKALNALNYNMIKAITSALLAWRNDDNIAAVVIKAHNDRAFCAGGDIKLLYQNGRTQTDECMNFFYDEYRLNTLIKYYPKPYIALINGITMGGGIGISLHGSHVVATHDLSLAMPESSIGFFTDIGASYFLPRCPDYTGYYMGLTGDKINCNDAKYIGLITNIVSNTNYHDAFNNIIEDLLNTHFTKNKNTNCNVINKLLTSHTTDRILDIDNSKNKIINNVINIKNAFNAANIKQIYNNLTLLNNEWATKVLTTLKTKSPTSLLLILELLTRGSELNFAKCMQMEYAVAYGFLTNDDFYEGVRALLIDKDNTPNWHEVKLNRDQSFNYKEYFNQSKADKLHLEDLIVLER